MSYRLLHVLSFCNQERLYLFIFKIEVSVVLQTTWKDYQSIKYLELVCQLGPGTLEKLWMDITKFCCQPFCFPCAKHGFLMVSSAWSFSLGSLSNDDGDGNENGKKAIELDWQNNNFARASRFLVHFVAVVAGATWKCLILRGREHKATTFFFFSWTLMQSCRIQLPKKCQHLTN